jgi:cytochrome c-type biogenesis protein CcmH
MKPSRRFGWWVAMVVVLASALTIGIAHGRSGETSNQAHIDAIAKTIRCPTCEGETVFESKAPAAEAIRTEIARQVETGRTDDEVRAYIAQRFGDTLLVVPPSSGFQSLVWVLPVVAVVLAFAGLFVAFRRWRRQDTQAGVPTDDDRAKVAAALAAQHAADLDGDRVDDRAGEGVGR